MAAVSIVVMNHGSSIEDERIVRCLSSINRQTFTDWEIYTLEDREESFGSFLNRVIEESTGEYIMFMNPVLVMAPNVLEALTEAARQGDCDIIPHVSKFVKLDNNHFAEMKDNLYGKLFSIEYMEQIIQENPDSFCMESEFHFWLRTLSEEDHFLPVENTYVYGEKLPLPQEGNIDDISMDAECRWIPLLDRFPESRKSEMIHIIMSQITDDETVISGLEGLAAYYPKDNNVQMDIAKVYVKPYYQRALSGDEAAYECCKSYLKALTSRPDLVQVLLPVLGMSNDDKGFMDRYDMEDFLFFRKWMPAISELEENKDGLQKLETLLETQINKVNEIERLGAYLKDATNTFASQANPVNSINPANLEGTALAEFTVAQYAEGKLGFRTILGSIKAWMKHKI